LGTVKLPNGKLDMEDGMLSVTIVPELNFDPLPVLKGTIIRSQVAISDKQAVLTGTVLFTEGYWYSQFWGSPPVDQVVTSSGSTINGRITNVAASSLTIVPQGGGETVVSFDDIRDLRSPRAYTFNMPGLGATQLQQSSSWTADF